MSIADYRKELAAKVDAARPVRLASMFAAIQPGEEAMGPEERLLKTLGDPNASASERLGALGGLKVLAFSSPKAVALRPQMVRTLRRVVAEQVPELVNAALRALTDLEDPVTRELLLSGLRDPRKAVVPAAQAFALLADDPHADAIPEARRAVERASDEAEIEAALSVLARDADSKGRLRDIVTDTGAPAVRRRAAAESLFALDQNALKRVQSAASEHVELGAFVDGLLGAAALNVSSDAEAIAPRRKPIEKPRAKSAVKPLIRPAAKPAIKKEWRSAIRAAASAQMKAKGKKRTTARAKTAATSHAKGKRGFALNKQGPRSISKRGPPTPDRPKRR